MLKEIINGQFRQQRKTECRSLTLLKAHQNKSQQDWGIDGMIKGFFVQKQARESSADQTNNINLKSNVSKIYDLLDTKCQTEKKMITKNKTSQVFMKVQKENTLNFRQCQSVNANNGARQTSTNRASSSKLVPNFFLGDNNSNFPQEQPENKLNKNLSGLIQVLKKIPQLSCRSSPSGRYVEIKNNILTAFESVKKGKRQYRTSSPSKKFSSFQPLISIFVQNANEKAKQVLRIPSFDKFKYLQDHDQQDLSGNQFNRLECYDSMQSATEKQIENSKQQPSTQRLISVISEEIPESIINGAQQSFDRWMKTRDCNDRIISNDNWSKNYLESCIYKEQPQAQRPNYTSSDQSTQIQFYQKFGGPNVENACQDIVRRLQVMRKLQLVKAFYQIKEIWIKKQKCARQQRSLSGIIAILKIKLAIRYVQVFAAMSSVKKIIVVHPIDKEIDTIKSEYIPETTHYQLDNNTQIKTKDYNNLQLISRSVSIGSNFQKQRILSDISASPISHAKSIHNRQQIQSLQFSSVHQYVIQKNEHTPNKKEAFQTRQHPIITNRLSNQNENICPPTHKRSNPNQGQKSTTDYKIDQLQDLQKKQVEQLLTKLLSIQQNNEQDQKSSMCKSPQLNKLEFPDHLFRTQRYESNPDSNVRHSNAPLVFTKPDTTITIENILSQRVKKSKPQQQSTPTEHKSTISQQCIPLSSNRIRCNVLCDNQNLLNKEEIQYQLQIKKNDTNTNNNQLTNHIFMQKVRIAKKFQQINKQYSGSSKNSIKQITLLDLNGLEKIQLDFEPYLKIEPSRANSSNVYKNLPCITK